MLEECRRSTACEAQTWLEKSARDLRRVVFEVRPQLASDAVPIRPERMCGELTKNLPDDAIVVVDTGHGGHVDGRDVRSARAHAELHEESARHSRLGVPRWERNAGLRSGPSSVYRRRRLWYHIGEIETAVRWKINRSPS